MTPLLHESPSLQVPGRGCAGPRGDGFSPQAGGCCSSEPACRAVLHPQAVLGQAFLVVLVGFALQWLSVGWRWMVLCWFGDGWFSIGLGIGGLLETLLHRWTRLFASERSHCVDRFVLGFLPKQTALYDTV